MKSSLFALLLLLPVAAFAGRYVIVLDAVHGGRADSGTEAARTLSSSGNAASPGGLREKDLTLELTLAVRDELKKLAAAHPGLQIEPLLTRTEDRNPDFAERARVCANAQPVPSAIISLHFNATENHRALGTVAVIRQEPRNPNFRADTAFARRLIGATSQAVARFVPGSKPREPITDAHLHHGAGSNFFHQLGQHAALAAVPKCFLEVEFIDRADVEKALLQPRRETFPVIARAIAEFLYAEFP